MISGRIESKFLCEIKTSKLEGVVVEEQKVKRVFTSDSNNSL